MSRPTDLPDWATNANYGAGARPWNGQPNKTAPSAGVKGEGFDPENPLYADFVNWLLNNHGKWIDYLDSTAGGAVFGDGSDGNITFDGSATVLGLAPSTGVYTATRDIFANNCTVTGASTVLKMNGWRLFVRGTLTTSGGASISADGGAGGNASGSTGGTAGAVPYAGGTSTMLQLDPAGYQAGLAGGNSSASGANLGPVANSLGGSGGNGGNGNSSGGIVTANTVPAATYGSPRAATGMIIGFVWGQVSTTFAWRPIYGGSGGCGGGGGTAGAAGGGGGGGGGVLCISARYISLAAAGDIHAAGGKGGNASTGGDGNSGGGGGGGGGIVILVYAVSNVAFTAATNTAGGAAGTGGGGGSAHPGVAGANGSVIDISIAAL